jgi:hypothetical protein
MILRQFASNQPYVMIGVPVVISAMLAPALYTGLPLIDADFPADQFFAGLYQNNTLVVLMAMALIAAGSFLINYIFNRNEFYNTPSFVPALMYALLGCTSSLYQISLPVLLSNLFFLVGIGRQLSVFRQTKAISEYFECGFWLGMAAVFFPPFLALAAGLWFSILYTRAFSWREHLLPILAFGVPFLYWLVYKYWFNELGDLILFRKVITFDTTNLVAGMNWYSKVFYASVGVAFVLALPRFLFLADRSSNRARNVKNTFVVMSLAAIAAFGLGYFLVLKWIIGALLIPTAMVTGYWFTNYRYSLAAPFVFYTILVSSVLVTLKFYGIV